MNTWESHCTLISRAVSSSCPSLPHKVTFKQDKLLGKDEVTRGLKPAPHPLSFTQERVAQLGRDSWVPLLAFPLPQSLHFQEKELLVNEPP